MLFSKAFSKTL